MINSKNVYDVAVIGGGPTGSQVAYKLAETGHDVIVLEKKINLNAQVCCTGIVSRQCVTEYSIPDSVNYRQVNGARLLSPGGCVLPVKREKPQAAILDRAAFNALWAERAQAKGARYLMPADVKNIRTGKSNAVVEFACKGDTLTVKARTVVVATGFGARLVDGLGLGAASDFVMGAQTEVETNDISEVEVYFGRKIAPAFFGWLVPTSPGKALLGLLSRRHPPAYLKSLLAKLVAEGKIIPGDMPFTFGGVPLKPLQHTYGERLLVAGTAAGQVKPLTGGGIYYGLLCADIAASTLHHALAAGDFSAGALARYERSWKRKLGSELRTGYRARRLYEILTDKQVDRIFELMLSSGLVEDLAASESLSFDWHAGVISQVFGQKLILKALGSVRLPFRTGKKEKST